MPAEIPPDLRDAVHRLRGAPLHLIDPDTNTAYVLIPETAYRKADGPSPPDEESELDETSQAQIEAAFAAGWNEPEMDDYDDYDAKRKNVT